MASVEEARAILETIGMPPAQHNEMSGLTLIALCGLTPSASWSTASRRPCTVTKGIMNYIREHYGANYAPNTRATVRRQVLHQFVHAHVAEYNPSIKIFRRTVRVRTTRLPKRYLEPSDSMAPTHGTQPWPALGADTESLSMSTSAVESTTWSLSNFQMEKKYNFLQASTIKFRRPFRRTLHHDSRLERHSCIWVTQPRRTYL